MKKFLLASALAALTFSAAQAADVAVYEPVPEAPSAATFNWIGAYIGAQVGYAWGNSDYSEPDFPSYWAYFDPDGFLGGIYGGYNYQLDNNFVIGGEADFAFSNIDGNSLYYSNYTQAPWSGTLGTAKVKWSGALRARAGYAFDRFMPYIAGGLAFAKYEYGILHSSGDGFSASKTMTGWTIGAGAEYAATDNLILRAEYRYNDFGSNRVDISSTSFWWTNDVDLKTHDIRFGIAYKF